MFHHNKHELYRANKAASLSTQFALHFLESLSSIPDPFTKLTKPAALRNCGYVVTFLVSGKMTSVTYQDLVSVVRVSVGANAEKQISRVLASPPMKKRAS